MKKVLIGVLALIMILGLVGCSSTPTEETNTTKPTETTTEPTPTEALSSWEIAHYVDDFGDETDGVYVMGVFKGSFSNTATSNSELGVIFACSYMPATNNTYTIRLIEYGTHKATFSSDDIICEIKIDGEIISGNLFRISDSDDLYILYDNDPLHAALGDALYEEKEIPFVIKYGKSKYSFVIDGKGYLELWKQMQKNNIEYDSKTSN